MSADPLVEDLRALARVPSAVPLGAETLITPDAPILVDYVQGHLRPRFEKLVASVPGAALVDLPLNQFAVRIDGARPGPSLALMAYTPTQHHNEMADPWSGDLRMPDTGGEQAVFGQGVTQNKAHQAVLLDLLRRIGHDYGLAAGTVHLCINNEGRSSHACSDAILDALPHTPDLIVQLFCTDFGIVVGNRGRVDVQIDLIGQATHSSSPPGTGRVIEAVADVIVALEKLDRAARSRTHPQLGEP